MLSATNLECVRGDRRLFSNVSFTAPEGTFLQLTGPNGSGKTSLLRIICGLMPPERGEVLWNGANIRSLAEEYFSNLTYLGHRSAVKEELSSAENLRISSGLAGTELTHDQAYAALERMGLKGREELAARLLSEGQRRRSALARLLTSGTKLWVLDEVLTALDKTATSLISRVIEEHLKEGGIAVVATHQEINITAGSFQRLELAS
jgi:heme exporter protein A